MANLIFGDFSMKKLILGLLIVSNLLYAKSWWSVSIPTKNEINTFIKKEHLNVNETDVLYGQTTKVVIFKLGSSYIWHGSWSANKAIQYIKVLKQNGLKIEEVDVNICWKEHSDTDKRYFQKFNATTQEKHQFKEWENYCSKLGDEI